MHLDIPRGLRILCGTYLVLEPLSLNRDRGLDPEHEMRMVKRRYMSVLGQVVNQSFIGVVEFFGFFAVGHPRGVYYCAVVSHDVYKFQESFVEHRDHVIPTAFYVYFHGWLSSLLTRS